MAALDLSMELLADRLQPLCQPAEWAGLFVDVFLTPGGITLALNGYSDKLGVLLERAVRSLATFQIDPCRYGPIKEKYLQTLSNFEVEQPHKQASQLVNIVTSQRAWTKAAMLEAAKDVTAATVQACLRNFLSVLHLEVLVYGNVTQKLAQSYLSTITEMLVAEAQTKPLCESLQHKLRELQFPKGITLYRHVSPTPRETSAVAVYYQCGPQSTRTNMLLELFFHLTHQHCYDVLRTRDQLGYIVMYSIRRSKGTHGLRIVVQSHYPPAHIQKKIMAFIEDLEDYLNCVSPERYENQRAVLKSLRLERPKRMGEQNARYWTEITSSLHQFNRDEIEAVEVSTLKKEEVTEFYRDYIRLGGEHQRTLTVHVTPTSSKAPSTESQMAEIECLDEFKLSLPAYPAPQPTLQTETSGQRLPNIQSDETD